MYTPKSFSITESEDIRKFISENGFGIIVSKENDQIHDTHTPMFISDDLEYIYGHIAKANPQWESWDRERNVKIIFHGPHAYISPSYYLGDSNVPTWNYTAISIDGKIELISDRIEQIQVIEKLIHKYEKGFKEPWSLNKENENLMYLFKAIVCFKIQIEKINAKFKLNQNKSVEDRKSVISNLRKTDNQMNIKVAEFMERSEQVGGANV